jgi:hypothetical protein
MKISRRPDRRLAALVVLNLLMPTINVTLGQAASDGIWISREALSALPTDGAAWDALLAVSSQAVIPGHASLIDQDSVHSRNTMAAALVAARLDSDAIRRKARAAIKSVIGTENGDSKRQNRLLQLGRNLPGYVIAADLIDLAAFDPTFDATFRSWIAALRTRVFDGVFRTIANADSHDPANWGAYDGAARAVIAAYLGDSVDLARSAAAFRSFVGGIPDVRWDYRSDVHDLSWQCSYPRPAAYVPINSDCNRDGHDLSGLLAQDMSRGGPYVWPPVYTAYPREALTGRTLQAEILFRAGYTNVYSWGGNGLLRAAQALRRLATVDPRWFEPDQLVYRIIATRYGISSWELACRSDGRSVSGVDWTHQPGEPSMVAFQVGLIVKPFARALRVV